MTAPHAQAGHLDPARLWSGGAATAVVAALTAVVGILLARGVFDVPVLAPKGDGVWGDANTMAYALVAAAGALVATALVQVLAATTPRFRTFFTWIMMLATAVATIAPLGLDVAPSSRVATSLINMVIGIAITSITNVVVRSAYRRPPPDYFAPNPGDETELGGEPW
ncbi:DUF6069 family protein [Actinophytocola sp.]|uniref:DUF6069 family protein n=1 Tax=Actinophytocola sp. TaxID=1872138 RepID=UPI00389A2753